MQFEQIEHPFKDLGVTPFFRHIAVEDIPASEREQRLVMKTIEAVEIRIAGDNRYVGVFPVDAFAYRDGHKTITYAERFADEYRAFIEGAAQESAGTPLEELSGYGISQAQLSLCRALRVYSIEVLHNLEGPNLRSLGVHANALKQMADAFMADRSAGNAAQRRIAELEAQLASLQVNNVTPEDEPIDSSAFDNLSDEELKEYIKARTGAAPRGQPSRETLMRLASEA